MSGSEPMAWDSVCDHEELRDIFDAAWNSLTEEERAMVCAEREVQLGGYAGGAA